MSPEDARQALAALLVADEQPLDLAVALIAADEQRDRDPAEMLAELDRIAAGVRIPEGAGVFDGLARLNHHLFVELGFKGDEESYDDPRNSLLDHVLNRRRGLPILLSVVMIEVGRRVGVKLEGVGFPGHFLVSPAETSPRFFVDPFRAGQIVREDTLRARLARMTRQPVGGPLWEAATAAVGTRAVLIRMSNNLKGSFFRRGDLGGTLRSVERLILLDPRDPENHRDRGWLLARVGRPAEAVPAYEVYLSARPGAEDAGEIRRELDALRRGEPVGVT